MTDVANAARFTMQHRELIRYSHERGAYLVHTGKLWKWDKSGLAVGLAKQTALSIYSEAPEAIEAARKARAAGDEQAEARYAARAGALAKHAAASQKRERISAMLALAQPDIAIQLDQLDADPWLLNVQNGTVDLRTGELRPHRPADYLTKICRAEYHPDAVAVLFVAFLARIFRTHPTLIDYMQKVFGYAASGSTREQCVFFLFGLGANGKTTLIDIIMWVLGDYGSKADPDLLMQRDGSPGHPTSIADLFGARMAVCSESNDGKRFDESRLKDLSGETIIKARWMYGDFFSFVMTAKIFLYSNHRPIVRGTDLGFWRRMKLIPFVETISEDEKDRDLLEKLKAEADGILAWIVFGAVLWQLDGLGDPPTVADATNTYRTEMDSIGLFIDDICLKADGLKSYAADLYAAYSKWCTDAGEHPLSQKRLGTALAEKGFKSDRCTYSNRRKWLGIGLKAIPAGENPEPLA
jgi:putative DNA primase/helicase